MSKYLKNAFKALDLLEDTGFDIDSDKSFDELSEFVKDDVEPDSVEVAVTKEEEKTPRTHVDDVVLQCCSCGSNIFKAEDDITIEDGADCCCIGEECPVCEATDGFKIIGKIVPYKDEYDIDLLEDGEDAKIDLTSKEKDPDEDEEDKEDKDETEDTVKEIKERLWRKARLNKTLNENRQRIMCNRRLDEAIPQDLARAYKGADSRYDRRSAVNPFYDNRTNRFDKLNARGTSTVDWQNVDYKELTKEQALALPRKERKNVRILADGSFVPLNSQGTSMAGNRNVSYEDIVNGKNISGRRYDNPSIKIYYTANEDPINSPISVDKLSRRYSYDSDKYDSNEAKDYDYDVNLGRHLTWDDKTWDERNYGAGKNTLEYAKSEYEKAVDDYRKGDISADQLARSKRNYDRQKYYMTSMDRRIAGVRRARHDARIYHVGQYPERKAMSAKRDALNKLKNQMQDMQYQLEAESRGKEAFQTGKNKGYISYTAVSSDLVDAQQEIKKLTKQIEEAQTEIDRLTKQYNLNNVDANTAKIDASIAKLEREVVNTQKKIDTLLKRKPENESFISRQACSRLLVKQRMQEAIENATIETDHDILHLSTEKKDNEFPEDNDLMLSPLDSKDKDRILNDTEEMPEDEMSEEPVENKENKKEIANDEDNEEENVSKLDVESFNHLVEGYMKKCYSNINSFNATKIKKKSGHLVIEGCVTFKSGKKKKTTFTLSESRKDIGKKEKRYIGMNESFSADRRAYIIEGTVRKGVLKVNQMVYSYLAKNKGVNESVAKKFEGTIRL